MDDESNKNNMGHQDGRNRTSIGLVKNPGLQIDSKIKDLFQGWFNNRMMVILMAIQHIRAMDPKMKIGVELFLHDVEHHFTSPHGPEAVRHAFRYLKDYFSLYPVVEVAESEKAIEMVGRIYEALGMELSLQSHYSVQLSLAEKLRRERQIEMEPLGLK